MERFGPVGQQAFTGKREKPFDLDLRNTDISQIKFSLQLIANQQKIMKTMIKITLGGFKFVGEFPAIFVCEFAASTHKIQF